MALISRRASIAELSESILDMAKTGVYRESVFEALRPMATKKSIRLAIAHAKKFGLHSVAPLRDETLGTYYQLDIRVYDARRHALHLDLPHDDQDLMGRAIATDDALDRMLNVARAMAIALLLGGLICWSLGERNASAGLLIAAITAGGVWGLQRRLKP